MLEITEAVSRDQLASAKQLFQEYAEWLDIDLGFQGFEQEMAQFPGKYQPPSGCILLAYRDQQAVGCIALRALADATGEIKRLYVSDDYRGLGVGKALLCQLIAKARNIGYKRLRLDTIPKMAQAQQLYRRLGFCEIKPYYDSPIPGTIYMELSL